LKWGEFFKAGGAAGYTPKEIREMSLWEFLMTIEGWKKANNVGEDADGSAKPPTEEEFEHALATMLD
jgi:hypothetical protein